METGLKSLLAARRAGMAQEELIEQLAVEFKKHAAQRKLRPDQPGYSGSLGDVFLPDDIVDEMEAAINEAFEQIKEEPIAE
jgi:predicted RecB family endonuclease